MSPKKKIIDAKQKTVVAALSKQVKTLPQQLRQSLTWDRGMELADHKTFTMATDVKVYFCDPQSPWQCGTNENTNRLLRQYFPKKTDLSVYSQAELNNVARRLINDRGKRWTSKPPQINYKRVLQRSTELIAAYFANASK